MCVADPRAERRSRRRSRRSSRTRGACARSRSPARSPRRRSGARRGRGADLDDASVLDATTPSSIGGPSTGSTQSAETAAVTCRSGSSRGARSALEQHRDPDRHLVEHDQRHRLERRRHRVDAGQRRRRRSRRRSSRCGGSALPRVGEVRHRDDLLTYLQCAGEAGARDVAGVPVRRVLARRGRDPVAVRVLTSIFVEEMLHLALGANLLNAVGGTPVLDHPRLLPGYPRPLPHGDPTSTLSLLPFGPAALDQFSTMGVRRRPVAPRPRARGTSRSPSSTPRCARGSARWRPISARQPCSTAIPIAS